MIEAAHVIQLLQWSLLAAETWETAGAFIVRIEVPGMEKGDFDVSIESVVQRALTPEEAEIVWVTHRCPEAHLAGALDVIGRLPVVRSVNNWIRVEE